MTTASRDPTTRVLKAGLEDGLRRFQDPCLLAEGRVNLISLDPLAETFGSRWSFQALRAEKFVNDLLTRELQPEDGFLQVSPTDVLISQPGRERDAAQVACLRYLRQILHQFLGSSARAPEAVYAVAHIESDRVEAQPISPAQLLGLEAAADLKQAGEEALSRATEPFIASHGRRVRVSCEHEPLINLSTGAPIGVRLAQRVFSGKNDEPVSAAELADFAGVDRQRIDWAVVVHGLAQLRDGGEQAPAIVVSISYATLSSHRGRAEIVTLLQEARRQVDLGVICEVSGVEGAPHAQLQEAVGIIRPLALFVVGKIDAATQVVWSNLRGVGLRGVAFDCASTDGDAEFLGWAKTTIVRGRRVAGSVLLYRVPSSRLLARLAEVGATHATVAG